MRQRAIFFEKCDIENCELAAEFGDIVYIFPDDSHRRSWLDTGNLTPEILQRLEQLAFDPTTDLIVTSGSICKISIMVAAVACYYGQFQALLWNARRQEYASRRIGTHEMSEQWL